MCSSDLQTTEVESRRQVRPDLCSAPTHRLTCALLLLFPPDGVEAVTKSSQLLLVSIGTTLWLLSASTLDYRSYVKDKRISRQFQEKSGTMG